MQTGKIKIEGMQTRQDVNKAIKVLNEVWGIRDVTLSLNTGEATIQYDETALLFMILNKPSSILVLTFQESNFH